MIETKDLTKRYGDFTAVDGISFKVEPGEVLGFLGPNGAGKSTTMRMIAGFLTPTEGTASVCGHDVETDALRARQCMGYLPEGAPSYGEMSVQQFLGFIADLRGLQGMRKQERIDDVCERLNLHEVRAQAIDTLSKGFRRRVGLAQAILHDPKVLVLDEPTDGLDPNQKHEVRSLIGNMSKDKIIVISTHILEEVDAVCTRAVIIAHGRILADETPEKLQARSVYHNAVTIRSRALAELNQALRDLPDIDRVEVDAAAGLVTALPKPGRQLFAPLTEMLRARNLPVEELRLERGRLDEVFRQITTENLPEARR